MADISASSDAFDFRRMMLADWYDGPTSGILVSESDLQEYYFFLVDWDRLGRERVFALRPLASTTIQTLANLCSETPSWPMWFPAPLKNQLQAEPRILREWKAIVACAGPPCAVLLWSNTQNCALSIRTLTEDVSPYAADIIEGKLHSDFDWFAYLGATRH